MASVIETSPLVQGLQAVLGALERVRHGGATAWDIATAERVRAVLGEDEGRYGWGGKAIALIDWESEADR